MDKEDLFPETFDDVVDEIIESTRPPGHKPVKSQSPKPEKKRRGRTKKQLHPDAQFAIERGVQEIEHIMIRFNEFEKEIDALALYPQYKQVIDQFKGFSKSLAEVIIGNFQDKNLSPQGMNNLNQLQQHRAKILTDIYNKYHEQL